MAALLVQGLSGCTPQEIVRMPPDFIAQLGLQQSLTPSRNNGFLNMFKLMQKKALDMYMQQQAGSDSEGMAASASSGGDGAAGAGTAEQQQGSSNGNGNGNNSEASATPVADSIQRKLREELQPLRLEVVDNSHQHAGHGGEAHGSSCSSAGQRLAARHAGTCCCATAAAAKLPRPAPLRLTPAT